MKWILAFLFVVTLACVGSLWFIENDGSITVVWLGYKVQTSVAFAIVAAVVLLVCCTLLLQLGLWAKHAPGRYRKVMMERRREKGYNALSEGFMALASGDTRQAKKLTKKVKQYLGMLPVVRLLTVQTAQSEGNKEQMKVQYTAMLEDKQTEMIAIKGLLIQAKEDGDLEKAVFLAEKAHKLHAEAEWPITVLIDLYKRLQRWDTLETAMREAKALKCIPEETWKRVSAVMALAHADIAAKEGHPNQAVGYAYDAYHAFPEWIPAITRYAAYVLATGDNGACQKVIERHWKGHPCQEWAELYKQAFSGKTKEKMVGYMEHLISLNPESTLSYVAAAGVAMEMGLFAKAREHLKAALARGETRALCQLRAELERKEDAVGDVVNYWQEKAQSLPAEDEGWQCSLCNHREEKWQSNCTRCGAFDTFEAIPALQFERV